VNVNVTTYALPTFHTDRVCTLLHTGFGEAMFILGMDIAMNMVADNVNVFHEQDTKELMEKFGMPGITPCKVPMAPTPYRDGEVAIDQDKVALSPS
jgi:hypothetical protein